MDELANAWVSDDHTPFQMGLLCVFDGAGLRRADGTLDVARVRDELMARAARVQGLTRRVVWTRFGEGRPLWAPDPAYDPGRHVVVASLPAGADLGTWAANRAVRPLDMKRPLWRAEVVEGLGDRYAVLVVMHHIVADAVAGLAILSQLLDAAPQLSAAPASAGAVPPLPTRRELVRLRLGEVRAALSPKVARAGRSRPRRTHSLRLSQGVMARFAGREPATSLPRSIGLDRRLATTRVPLAEVTQTAHALGVTVNDLLLAAVTAGLRDLLAARGDLTAGMVLRASVPAATGSPGQVVGMLVAQLPVGEPDPLRRLALVACSTSSGKSSLRAGVGDGEAVLRLPVFLARPLTRWARRLGSHRLSLSVADIRGPSVPLWLAGAQLREVAPIAPLVPLVPLCVAGLSYAGELAITVNADAAVTDLDRLRDGIRRSLATMHELARAGARLPPLPAARPTSPPA